MARLNSLRARMTFGFVLVLAPFLLLTCIVLALISQRLETDQTQDTLRETVAAAKRIVARPDWPDSLAALAATARFRERELGLEVTDGRGGMLWRSSDGLPARPEQARDVWQIAIRRVGSKTIYALHPIVERRARRTREIEELLTLSLLVVLAAAAGAWAMVGSTLRPIHRLAEQAARASAGNLQAHLTSPSPDSELVELVGTLNGLLNRQAQAAAAKGRFYAAASHELRTPLQALSGHLELALSRPRNAAEYQAALQEAQGQTERLIALVRALLLLHQLEGQTRPPQEPVDLAAVCAAAWAQALPRLEGRGLRAEAEIAEGAVIRAVPTHAEILLRNLLENAARYALEGGRVTLSLCEARSGFRLEVYNDCALREGDDPQTWLEPFRRPDAARAASIGGNGLGLAICRALADANGWKIEMRREENGVRAVVRFETPTELNSPRS